MRNERDSVCLGEQCRNPQKNQGHDWSVDTRNGGAREIKSPSVKFLATLIVNLSGTKSVCYYVVMIYVVKHHHQVCDGERLPVAIPYGIESLASSDNPRTQPLQQLVTDVECNMWVLSCAVALAWG